jgi:hypothetical protein
MNVLEVIHQLGTKGRCILLDWHARAFAQEILTWADKHQYDLYVTRQENPDLLELVVSISKIWNYPI